MEEEWKWLGGMARNLLAAGVSQLHKYKLIIIISHFAKLLFTSGYLKEHEENRRRRRGGEGEEKRRRRGGGSTLPVSADV